MTAGRSIPYLIVNVDYATTCSGTCPTCVLTAAERASPVPATTPAKVASAFGAIAGGYGRIGVLAIGVGRANVLALPRSSVAEVAALAEAAATAFSFDEGVLEISTSLIGKIGPQVDRARELVSAVARTGFDARFVVVGNTALASEKYWANLDRFLRELSSVRGGQDKDGSGDILQLALTSSMLPDPETLLDRLSSYRFPVNIAWAPAFDAGAADEGVLDKLGSWLADFYRGAAQRGLDSSLVTRSRQSVEFSATPLPDLPRIVSESARSVVYVAPDGTWHKGYFSILAEMDPVRFDPDCVSPGRSSVVTDPFRDISRLMKNRACAACPHISSCIAGGAHRIALMVLRRHPRGTDNCPSGLRRTFEAAADDIKVNA